MAAKMKSSMGSELGRAVILSLKRLAELSADDLTVGSDGEMVTLEGFVRNRDEKRAAEKAALQVYGVKAVASDIVVKPIPERPDTDIVRDILHEFQSHILIPITEVKAIVSNGLVTLEGSVSSQFEKLIAEAAVKSVRGVTGIRNNIEVEPQAFSTGVRRATDAQKTISLSDDREALAELGATEAG